MARSRIRAVLCGLQAVFSFLFHVSHGALRRKGVREGGASAVSAAYGGAAQTLDRFSAVPKRMTIQSVYGPISVPGAAKGMEGGIQPKIEPFARSPLLLLRPRAPSTYAVGM